MTDEAEEAEEAHVRREQLFALIWANRDNRPPAEGEDADPELERMFGDLGERFFKDLAAEFRLGPETAERLWGHALTCKQCRLMLLEDGPGARPPKTEAEVQKETEDRDAARRKKVVKFWIDLAVGVAAFGGAFWLRQLIAMAKMKKMSGPVIGGTGPETIDPRWYGFVIFLLIASWFLAEAYVIARELWIDFRAWKRAVPVIGKKWAERDKFKKK
jgi:hypothetical protein